MQFVQTLKVLAKDHTILVVTHSPYLLSHCQGVVVMRAGKLVAAGPAAQLLPKLGINVAGQTPVKPPTALATAGNDNVDETQDTAVS